MSIALKSAHLHHVERRASRSNARDATELLVRSRSDAATSGVLQFGDLLVRCALGKGGITRDKREGDGATPAGTFDLIGVYYRADRIARPQTALPVTPLAPDMGWCDAPGHARYNRLVARPFAASHEVMWRADRLYDIVVVLDCNLFPAVPGKGSAIFFHLARSGYTPTEGCVAVSLRDMRLVLQRCGPGSSLVVGD